MWLSSGYASSCELCICMYMYLTDKSVTVFIHRTLESGAITELHVPIINAQGSCDKQYS